MHPDYNAAEAMPPAVLDASKLDGAEAGCNKCRRPAKHTRCLRPTARTLKANSKEYCTSAAIHGLRYFVEDGRTIFERVFWVLSLVASLVGCTIMISKLYGKWGSDPVIVSPAEKPIGIWEVPFPAVTICPDTLWPKSKFNFNDVSNRYRDALVMNDSSVSDVSEAEKKKLAAATLICPFATIANDDFITLLYNVTVTEQTFDILHEWAEDTLTDCMWNTDSIPTCEVFSRITTDGGTCFTFNMLRSTELFEPKAVQYNKTTTRSSMGWNQETWTLELPKDNKDRYPLRTRGDGDRFGLSVSLYSNTTDNDYLCSGFVQGYKVILHSPAEIPSVRKQYYHVSHNERMNVEVKPAMMTTTKDLLNSTPDVRKCYKQKGEKTLKYFQVWVPSPEG